MTASKSGNGELKLYTGTARPAESSVHLMLGPVPYVTHLDISRPHFESVTRAVIADARRLGRQAVQAGDRIVLGSNLAVVHRSDPETASASLDQTGELPLFVEDEN